MNILDPEQFERSARRPEEERQQEQLMRLRAIVRSLQAEGGRTWRDPPVLHDPADLEKLPLLRKDRLAKDQALHPPFGENQNRAAAGCSLLFQSPGPIYEPGQANLDWWRIGRFLSACGIGSNDVILNAFSYHLTPAGMMMETAARAVGAKIIPAGTAPVEQQLVAIRHYQATAYCGTPDFLKTLLVRAEEQKVTLPISKAAVSGGPLFPELREFFRTRGITCLQCYATADLGLIAYEAMDGQGQRPDGLFLDEDLLVEIVRPGSGQNVPAGEVGEVVVTLLNPEYPLIRLATGDLSKFLTSPSGCGRTARRIAGWMGRADQTAKVRGQFLRPSQVAQFVDMVDGLTAARLTISRKNDRDLILVSLAGPTLDMAAAEQKFQGVFGLKPASINLVDAQDMPNDGKVIDDQRDLPDGG